MDANHAAIVKGREYREFMADLHRYLKPRSYFEIGVQHGNTLKLANCDTIAVDPTFVCNTNITGKKPSLFLFQETSDEFFQKRNPARILGKPIDFAFLDGMHRFEFLLRDFMNTEKFVAKESVVLMHDCLPPGFYMTSRDIQDANDPRSGFPGWWAGDVWKLVPTLRKYRPDLDITITDCVPTGLVIVRNLDPSSDILQGNYDSIINNFKPMDREEYDAYWTEVEVTPVTNVDIEGNFRSFS